MKYKHNLCKRKNYIKILNFIKKKFKYAIVIIVPSIILLLIPALVLGKYFEYLIQDGEFISITKAFCGFFAYVIAEIMVSILLIKKWISIWYHRFEQR